MVEDDLLDAFEALFRTLGEEQDAAAGTALFADDDDIVMWGSGESERAVGRAAVAELHRAIASLPRRLSFRWDERHLHVNGDTAWVSAAGHVVVEQEGRPEATARYRATAVLVRRDGSWLWHTFHGSEPAPE